MKKSLLFLLMFFVVTAEGMIVPQARIGRADESTEEMRSLEVAQRSLLGVCSKVFNLLSVDEKKELQGVSRITPKVIAAHDLIVEKVNAFHEVHTGVFRLSGVPCAWVKAALVGAGMKEQLEIEKEEIIKRFASSEHHFLLKKLEIGSDLYLSFISALDTFRAEVRKTEDGYVNLLLSQIESFLLRKINNKLSEVARRKRS
jgi:hypothetical protein